MPRKGSKKAQLIRRKSRLSVRKKVLIVCEGEKTEPQYINALAVHLGLSSVEYEIFHKHSDPNRIIDEGLKRLEKEKDFDIVLFVFDRDSHDSYDQALSRVDGLKIQRKYTKIKFEAITSIPCFEIWFLFHFSPNRRSFARTGGKSPCDNLISELKRIPEMSAYAKGNNTYFDILSSKINTAKRNSANVLRLSATDGDKEHHGNPSTRMHILVEMLEKLAEENKRK